MTRLLKTSSFLTLAVTGALTLSASAAEAETCGWNARAPLPSAGYASNSVTVDGKIYVLGKFDGSDPSDVVNAYDPSSNSWEPREPMPNASMGFGLAAIDRRVYRAGGMVAGETSAELFVYDIDGDSWDELAPLPAPVTFPAAAAVDGKFYVIGGTDMDGSAFATVNRYDPATDEWTEMAPLQIPRTIAASAAANGKIYVVGGVGIDPDTDQAGLLKSVSVYDTVADEWSELSPLANSRAYASAASFGGQIYVVGGILDRPDLTEFTGAVDRFDPSTNTWAAMPSLPSPRALAATSFIGDKLYVMGGMHTAALADVIALPVLAKSGLLTRTQAEAAGTNCAAGGTRLDNGFDTNCNGALDDGDTIETVYLCHGEDGASAHEVVVETTDEPAGDKCANGGVRVSAGYDTDDDGKLSAEEITKTTYICHGAKGPGGADGSAGVDGASGKDGEPGAEGGCSMAQGGARSGSLFAIGLSALALLGLRRRNKARA